MLVTYILLLGLLPLCVAGSRLAPKYLDDIEPLLSCAKMKDSTFTFVLNHTLFTAERFNTKKSCVTWECVRLVVETLPDEFIESIRPITGRSKHRLIDDITGDLSFISDARYGQFLSWIMSAGLRRQTVCWLTSETDLFRYYEDPLGAIAAYLIDPSTIDGTVYRRFATLPDGPLREDQTMCFSPDSAYYQQIHRSLPQLRVRNYLQYQPKFNTYEHIRWHTSRWSGLFGRALFEMTQKSYSCSGYCGCDPSLESSRPMIPQSYSQLWTSVHWLMERNKPFCLSTGWGNAGQVKHHYWMAVRGGKKISQCRMMSPPTLSRLMTKKPNKYE
ncbi:hypothetical protein L249_8908 [Ophiocordyceps polyrhachis-furcata BCC 54312]|uniref:Uncharacterized protein n=1 Tax=Ophiocordyceps polyrhachis-furcata BCC 54312 TaxID=1330021 RepID=A0A367L1V8_9HYPO|nr:hypothetical protein L249_8908 [Ophiocordyceps polyrhachis-furcata BCC 54312]